MNIKNINIEKLSLEDTLRDLEILKSQDGSEGVISYFDTELTKEGREKLNEIFKNPINDIHELNKRQKALKYIIKNITSFELVFKKNLLSNLSNYLKINILTSDTNNFFDKINFTFFSKNEYLYIESGVKIFFDFYHGLKIYYGICYNSNLPIQLKNIFSKFHLLLSDKSIKTFISQQKKINYLLIDGILRGKLKNIIEEIINDFFYIEALLSIAKAMIKYNLNFPEIRQESDEISIKDLWHFFIDKPIKNNLLLNKKNNILFITGPNMSGKTTYIKSCGIAVYLAHLGIGVPADEMTCPIFDNIITDMTTIENIRLGYSYYFSEVKKIKEIFINLSSKKKCFIICDEIFKGTNIKDSLEASKIVLEGFTECKNSFFVFSTHLTELSKQIKNSRINYKCFLSKSNMKDEELIYPYKLSNGISKERLGIAILKKEGILRMIEDIKNGNN